MHEAIKTWSILGLFMVPGLMLVGAPVEAQVIPLGGNFTATKPDDCRRFFGTPNPKNTIVTSQLNGCLNCFAQGGVKVEITQSGSICSTDATVLMITTLADCAKYKTTSMQNKCKECFFGRAGRKFIAADATPNPQCVQPVIATLNDCAPLIVIGSLIYTECSNCVKGGKAFAVTIPPRGTAGAPYSCNGPAK